MLSTVTLHLFSDGSAVSHKHPAIKQSIGCSPSITSTMTRTKPVPCWITWSGKTAKHPLIQPSGKLLRGMQTRVHLSVQQSHLQNRHANPFTKFLRGLPEVLLLQTNSKLPQKSKLRAYVSMCFSASSSSLNDPGAPELLVAAPTRSDAIQQGDPALSRPPV